MHHLDSWIKVDQLDVTCFIISLFTVQHVSNVSTSIFRSLRLIVDLFHVLYCSVRVEVLATANANAKTSILTEQYNTWNKSTICRKLQKMDVLTFKTCWTVNSEIIKQVTSSWSTFIQLSLISFETACTPTFLHTFLWYFYVISEDIQIIVLVFIYVLVSWLDDGPSLGSKLLSI